MTTQTTPRFGALLRGLRIAAGLTQEALAERARLSTRGLQDLERGVRQTPRRDTAELLATALGLTPADHAAFLALAASPPRRPPEAPLPPRPGTGPTPMTPLLGRAREVAEVLALLRREEVRLLTLTGPGGVGKTRLALAVARALDEQAAGGVTFVDLTTVHDPHLLPQTIAQALGLGECGGQPLHEVMLAHLQPRHLLLLLDNAEHLLPAVAEVATLRATCPGLRLLVTSRVALHLQGEQVYPVPPLALPAAGDPLAPEALDHVAAVALFVQRAQAMRPDFVLSAANAETVAAICRHLDGLPLAIELAAAWSRMLPPAALLARLEQNPTLLAGGTQDLPARQRTLQATIAWSEALLAPAEQVLFRRLAVFAGGCTLEAVEAVCADVGDALPAPVSLGTPTTVLVLARPLLGGLSAVVEAHLLRSEEGDDSAAEPWFRQTRTIRAYAQERLAASGEADAVRERHAAYYLCLAEEVANASGQERERWLGRLEREHDNLRAALGWARERGAGELGLRLAVALTRFWMLRGYLQEGRGWLNGLLGLPGGDQALRARALGAAGLLAFEQTDYDGAIALLDEALAMSGPLERSLVHGGDAAEWHVIRDDARSMSRGDAAEGVALLEESVARCRTWRDRPGLARALMRLGFELRLRGEHRRARAALEEGVAGYRALGDAPGLSRALYYLALVVREQGEYARATGLSEEAVALARALQARHGLAWALLGLCDVARDQGAWERVGPPAEESLALSRALGVVLQAAFALHNMALAAHGLGDAARARALLAESEDLVAAQGMPYARAEIVHSRGLLARDAGDWATARALMAESLAQFGAGGMLGHVPRSLEGLASLLALRAGSGAAGLGSQGMAARAARLLAAATAQRATRGTPLPPAEQPAYEQAMRTVRALLGQEAEAVAWAAGEALQPEQAVADALALAPPAGAEAPLAGGAAASPRGAPELRAPTEVADSPSFRRPSASIRGAPTEALVPLVGRASELALLERFLSGERAQPAPAPALVLAGEPGMGKTRLLQAATQRAVAEGWCVLVGGCQRRGGQASYAPLLEALAQHLHAADPAYRRAALEGCAWLVRLLPELAQTPVGASLADTLPAVALAPEQERRLMHAAVARLLTNVAGPAGTLMVLDDLQWAGADALDLLATLLRTSTMRLRLLGAYRDTEVRPADPLGLLLADLAPAGLVRHHPLGPLAPEEAAALLDDLLVDLGEGGRELAAGILQRAGGTPFFLVSYAQALRQGSGTAVPWDLAQGVRQRVALLPPAGQELLGAAAAVGRHVSRALLLAVAGQAEEEALVGLEAACRARLLVEEGEDAYVFAHDLIREVVEADLGAARRAALHRRVAEALEARPGEPPAEALAYHYDRGGSSEKAASYLERAGDHAWVRHAHAAAESHYRAALDRLAVLGRVKDAAPVRAKLGEVLYRAGRYDAALQALEQAAETFRAAGEWEAVLHVTVWIGRTHAHRGTPLEGIADLTALLGRLAVGNAASPPSVAPLYLELGRLLFVAGQYNDAMAASEQAADSARAGGDDRTRAHASLYRANILKMLGRLGEALCADQEVLSLMEELSDQNGLLSSQRDLAYIHMLQGTFATSRRYLDGALAIARELGDPGPISSTLAVGGWLDLLRGEWHLARAALDEAVALSRQVDRSWHGTYAMISRARLSLAAGERAAATAAVQEALALAEGSGDLQALRWASGVMAELDLLAGAPEAARARLVPLLDRPGLEECDVTTLLPLLGWAQVELGQVDGAADTVAQALRRARPEEMRLALVEALRVQALIALRRGQRDEATSSLEEGLAMARGMPYPYAEARLLHVYGDLHAQLGDPQAARERLEAAQVTFARLGAQRDLTAVAQAVGRLSQNEAPACFETAVSDTQWAQVQALLPPPARTGRHRVDDRRTLEAILYVQRTGCAWAELPSALGDEATAHRRWRAWQAAGLWERIAAIAGTPPAMPVAPSSALRSVDVSLSVDRP